MDGIDPDRPLKNTRAKTTLPRISPRMLPETKLARWFVCEFNQQSWIEHMHKHQVVLARELLTRYDPDLIMRTCQEMACGHLATTKYVPTVVYSLAFLLRQTFLDGEVISPITEVARRDRKVIALRRPEILDIERARDLLYLTN